VFVVDQVLLVTGVLLLAGIFASKFAVRLGLPVLILFILVGMLAGEEGLGGIVFDNYTLAHGIGTVALCVILFDGGLRTPLPSLKSAWKPAGLLATLGVLFTSLMTGVAAAWILDLTWLEGILLGSIVGSTDAAAVFSILRSKGLHLNQRLSATLEVESGSNDPMAIFLTVGVLEILLGKLTPGPQLLGLFGLQMGVGLAVGLLVGWLAVRLINRIRLDAAGLYPVLTGVCGLLAFGLAALFGGSGFLSVYVAGIWVGNSRIIFQRGTLLFHDGIAWISQMAMFVVLGLLSYPSELFNVAIPSLCIAAVLILVARPIAVIPLLLPFKFNLREVVFVSWVGLKGAVPVILATYPLLFGLPIGSLMFNVVFFIVLISAVTQGWSLPFVARFLGLQQVRSPEPSINLEITSLQEVEADIIGYTLRAGAKAIGRQIKQLALPDGMVVAMVSRNHRLIPPRGSTRLCEEDHVFVVLRSDVRPLADAIFRTPKDHQEMPLPLLVEFPFKGVTTVEQLHQSYGICIPQPAELTLHQLLFEAHGENLHEGSLLEFEHVTLHARELTDGRSTTVGLVLSKERV
jgi:cell volume regulation protein A